jgi:rSAM/selenodomain-associated transferase 2/rSAM/selenodomain-associated transferase 1
VSDFLSRQSMTGDASKAREPPAGSLSRKKCAERLIVFTRLPQPGRAKTRLIPSLGAEGAATVHAALARKTIAAATRLCRLRSCELEIRYADGSADEMANWFGAGLNYRAQEGGDLGERLAQAMATAFDEGAAKVVIVGADSPDLSVERIAEAFDSLQHRDVVLGPAFDGGYYLIGLNRPQSSLFQHIDWGTEKVHSQTLQQARRERLRVHQLQPLADVDFPEDLVVCRRYADEFARALPTCRAGWLSIIIPVLNEQAALSALLPELNQLSRVEVIVADGGSVDDSLEVARRLGATVVSSRKGRGRQLNAGAALASGDTLLFLHSDSKLPANFRDSIDAVLGRGCVAGAFQLAIDDPRRSLRCVEWGVNLRSKWLKSPYGDQGIFVRADTFFALNGFAQWPLLEDVDLVRRVRAKGSLGIVDATILTSARRWRKLGVIRTSLINHCVIVGYLLGISPARLARWYYA